MERERYWWRDSGGTSSVDELGHHHPQHAGCKTSKGMRFKKEGRIKSP
jgi:hypothetical protein